MVQECNVKVIEPRTQDRVEKLADALVELYLQKMLAGTATASEMKAAQDYIKDSGIKLIIGPATKAGELERKIPKLPPISDEEKVLRLG